MTMIHTAAKNSRLTLDPSPMPNHTMNRGSRAKGGTGRNNSTMGSKMPRNRLDSPMANPTGTPTITP